ncbi:PDDEXK nuclease domain-containing protein [Lolliginicoccus lacisalsi]|uniref:PDDEXK nuclease domain-containing protein n=1 Tax=Lolliginicoccus lacisalsi TaxID=2742202 RepID=UPI001CDC174A|nr:PDDEXK nuclease domain-containing protein [Lolliginicoccus lacisalsi]
MKDPYKLDFLGLGEDAEERAIEQALVDHVAKFLVELGAGFALKATEFKPEHIGQLGFYMAAIDGEIKGVIDGPTIGLLLCKTQDKVVAEYALRNVSAPLGVSEYDLVKDLPEPLATNLPTIDQIERELGDPES